MTASPSPSPIFVLGAGAFGTALANIAARKKRRVFLWARDLDHVLEMRRTRANAKRLPGVALAPSVEPTDDLALLRHADIVLAAVPAQAIRQTAKAAAAHVKQGADWVICAKGFERKTDCFLSDVITEEIPSVHSAVLSGPSFAADIAGGLPTAVTLAHGDVARGEFLCETLGGPTFRLYRSQDVRGVEIGGAVKNVLAIACGVASGRGLGASAHAALIARGFAEMQRFGAAFGAKPETLMGLSGLGDLVLTCSSPQSRNFAFGFALGSAASEAFSGSLAEGALTAGALAALAKSRHVDMPISACVVQILSGAISVEAAIDSLLLRPQRAEI